jgi:uncharacterized membrane protein
MAYHVLLFLHLLAVMSFFGVGAASDAALVYARRNPERAAVILDLVRGRNLMMELGSGVLALLLGFGLIMVNPAGMAIMKTGPWIHAKLGAAILSIVLVLGSRAGVKADGVAKWVVPVRGTGFLLAAVAVYAVKVMRGG